MRYDYITVDFYPVLTILFVLWFMYQNQRMDKKTRDRFSIFAAFFFAELLIYNLELFLKTAAGYRILHTMITAAGYSLRPFMLYAFIVIINRHARGQAWKKYLRIPAWINVFYALAPFYLPPRLSYWYDASSQFHRGTLGFFPYGVALFYLTCMVVIAIRIRREHRYEERIIIGCAVMVAFGMIAEGYFGSYALLRICVAGALAGYYMFFQSQIYNDYILQKTIEQANMADEFSLEMMTTLAGTIDAKDAYTIGHAERVAGYAREIARRAGKSQEDQAEIYYMGMLHDIGKIGIPDSIIHKKGRLTDEEYSIIKTHPVIGADLLRKIKSKPNLYIGARWHHERYDGKGYPDGLKGMEIPEAARIISVADAYDAMTSDRAYREALAQNKVQNIIRENKGLQFDPLFAEVMLQMIEEDKDYRMKGSDESALMQDLREVMLTGTFREHAGPVSTGDEGFSQIVLFLRQYVKRRNLAVQIVLITMNPLTEEAADALSVYERMQELSDILSGTIRSSDVMTQINLRQYLLILTDSCTASAEIPENRIRNAFLKKNPEGYSLAFEAQDILKDCD